MRINEMEFELPFPSAKLHAHAKGNFWAKAKATSEARAMARVLAKGELARTRSKGIPGSAIVSYTFYVGDKRRRDVANMVQSCKPYIDGIVDSGAIEGDHWQALSQDAVEVIVRKGKPGVKITLRKKEIEATE